MEPMVWQSLAEIAESEGYMINDLCTCVDQRRGPMGLTAAIRMFILHYFRLAVATAAPPNGTEAESGIAPAGFSDPGTTDVATGPATVEQALKIFQWSEETLSQMHKTVKPEAENRA
jgi:hypothetical protein